MLELLDGVVGSLLGLAIATTLLLLWAASLADLFRRHDLSVARKGMWAAIIILTAHIGVAVYFAMRPIQPPYGKGAKHTVNRSSNLVNELERLHTEHSNGTITNETYLAAKRDLLGITN